MATPEPEVTPQQLEYVQGLESELGHALVRIRQMEAAWARGAPCPNIVQDDEGTAHCTLAVRCSEEHA